MAIAEFNAVEFNEAEFNEGGLTLTLTESISSTDTENENFGKNLSQTITLSAALAMFDGALHFETVTLASVIHFAITVLKTQTITLSAVRAMFFTQHPLTESIDMTGDTLTKQPNKIISDAIFMTPDTLLQITGKGFNETFRLADWLEIKRKNPGNWNG